MSKVHRIYKLLCDGRCIYVGRTTQTLKARLAAHLRDARTKPGKKNETIKIFLNEGMKITIELVEEVENYTSNEEFVRQEAEWDGAKLLNSKTGDSQKFDEERARSQIWDMKERLRIEKAKKRRGL